MCNQPNPYENYRLSIVIINYKTPEMVTDCIASLLPELEGIDAIVQIVDNDSNDGSVDKIRQWLNAHVTKQKINLIESGGNLGFSGGNNVGIKAARADYYLLLNSDTLVRTGSVKALLATVEQYPQAGLVSPRLEWPDGTPQISCFRFHTPFSELILSARSYPVTRLLDGYQVPLPVSDTVVHPEWASFACIMVRREVFDAIGLMDDGFFMYYEDSEFCYQARKAGWDIIYMPTARVVHLRGGSSPVKERTRQNKRLPRYYYESRTRYFYKLYGRAGITAANLLWHCGRLISLLRELVGSKEPHICESQWRDIWINFWNPLKPYKLPK